MHRLDDGICTVESIQRRKTWAAAHQGVSSFPVQEGHLAAAHQGVPSFPVQEGHLAAAHQGVSSFPVQEGHLAAAHQGVPSFPVQEGHLALYMVHLSESTKSKAAVEEIVHAVSWLHKVTGLQPPNASPLVHTTLEGLQRKLAKPKKRKRTPNC